MDFESKIFKLHDTCHSNIFNLAYKKDETIVDNVVVKRYKYAIDFNREVKNLKVLSVLESVPKIIATRGRYVIMEKFPGCDLMDWLLTKKIFDEGEIRIIIKQLLLIVNEIHSHNIIHRDIKPENIVYDEDNQKVYLVDFDQKITKKYTSPENIKQRKLFSETSDVWGVGVVCYNLLTKTYPWQNDYDVFIKKYKTIRQKCSQNMLDFIDKMLNKDCQSRLTIKEALVHPWIIMDDISAGVN